MPAATSEVLEEIDRLLSPQRFDDYCVNGLQVPGPEQVQRLVTGVSAHAELFERAADEDADLLLVHHGLFWGPGVRLVDSLLKRRLQILFDADIALAAYHLPLDAHPQVGNNALLAAALGAGDLQPFAEHHGETIGFIASLPDDGIDVEQLFERVTAITGRQPIVFAGGPELISRVAIVAGAGADYTVAAAAAGAHALITGELAERSMALALESGVHLVAAGHYATETLGIRRLGELVAERFALDHVFIDVPNPV